MYNFGARKPERMYNIGAHTHTAHVTDRLETKLKITAPSRALEENGQQRVHLER